MSIEDDKPVVTHIHNADMYVDWDWKGLGFGQLSFYIEEDGKIHVMNEYMTRDSVRKILHAMADYVADHAVLTDNPSERKHEVLEEVREEHAFHLHELPNPLESFWLFGRK